MTIPEKAQPSFCTIGHSNLEPEALISALKVHSVTILCDVRSRPGSQRFPQFNREPLEELLASAGIRYAFLGTELGGRPEDPRAYGSDGRVDYVKRRQSDEFLAGLSRVLDFGRTNVVALMCAEEDPLDCHRFLLICPALVVAGVSPRHIRRGGILESQHDAEDRLLGLHGFSDVTSSALFSSGRASALEDALGLQAKECAFRTSPEALEYLY